MKLAWLFPSNAFRRGHFVEHRPEGEDVACARRPPPFDCSGAMYWKVPRMCLAGERRRPSATGRVLPGAGCAGSSRSPKSRSLAPPGVSIMLPGFKSRWTTPGRCARSSASAIPMAYRSDKSLAEKALRETRRRVLAFHELHDQVVGRAPVAADIEEHAYIGMIERRHRDGFRFALEARAQFGFDEKMFSGRTLMATSRPRRVSRAR